MKKNNVMRIASALLVAVLLTTCAISGTFAKYTTTASGSSTARVAKWGFGNATEIEFDLFSDNYNDVVVGTDGALVIAPGTEGSEEIALVADAAAAAAATEVAYTFEVDVDVEADDDALLDKLQWNLNGGAYGDLDALLAAIDALFEDQYNPGDEAPDTTFTIGWKWDFESGDDTGDTNLGAGDDVNVTVTISFTATQVGATETTTAERQ